MICMTCAANCYLDLLDKLQKQVYRAVGSKTAASPPLNGNRPKPFFLCGFSFKNIHESQDSRERGGHFINSSVPLSPAS